MSTLTKPVYLTISGIMGVGKTTAGELLASRLDLPFIPESADKNIFLELSYTDGPRWALASQLWYFGQHLRNIPSIQKLLSSTGVIEDVNVRQGHFLYVLSRYQLGHINEQEYQLYKDLYESTISFFPVPDLVINLEAGIDTIWERLRNRNRLVEKTVEKSYLELLAGNQRRWMNENKTLRVVNIDTEKIDLVSNEKDKSSFVATILEHLN